MVFMSTGSKEYNNKMLQENLSLLRKEFKVRNTRPSSLPTIAIFVVHTPDYCNLNCNFCYFKYGYGPQGGTDPEKFNDYYKAMEPLFPYLEVVRFECGEPLFHPFIKDCYLNFLKGNYAGKPEIVTNGTLLDDFWIETIIKRFLRMNISLNAAKPETYTKITRQPYTVFKRLIRNISELVNL